MLNLKSYRKLKRLRQIDVAEGLSVGQATISKLEAETMQPNLELAFMIEDWTEGAVPARSWLEAKDNAPKTASLDDEECTEKPPPSPYPKGQVQRSQSHNA